jgi:hypothetical protein
MQQVDLVRASDDAVLAFWREVEVQTRRLAAVDHRVIVDLERRGLAGLGAYASTAAMARDVLRIAPGEATARVDAAHRLGPRWSPSQPVVPAQFRTPPPQIAQGAQAGEISARHAAVVIRAVDQLPDEIVDELGGWVQSHLLEQARVADPVLLARYATSLIDRLDQDGRPVPGAGPPAAAARATDVLPSGWQLPSRGVLHRRRGQALRRRRRPVPRRAAVPHRRHRGLLHHPTLLHRPTTPRDDR